MSLGRALMLVGAGCGPAGGLAVCAAGAVAAGSCAKVREAVRETIHTATSEERRMRNRFILVSTFVSRLWSVRSRDETDVYSRRDYGKFSAQTGGLNH